MQKPSCTNPKAEAARHKPDLRLIPLAALIPEARAFEAGLPKYGAYNYLGTEVRAGQYVSAVLRHLLAWQDGEDFDPESGVHHLGCARANLGILLHGIAAGVFVDDRPHTLAMIAERVATSPVEPRKGGGRKRK